jgi:hypothetical protein
VNAVINEVSRWLVQQLMDLPDPIRAVYVEWNNSYQEPNTPREIVFVSLAIFGFDSLSKGEFDCSVPEHLALLGDFIWEGPSAMHIRETDHPDLDWTDTLIAAAKTLEVRKRVRGRGLMLLVGYHDDTVHDVS